MILVLNFSTKRVVNLMLQLDKTVSDSFVVQGLNPGLPLCVSDPWDNLGQLQVLKWKLISKYDCVPELSITRTKIKMFAF